MSLTHIAELLIEANKKISGMIEKAENETAIKADRQVWINDLNTVIRQLDHIVEKLENDR